MFTMLVQCAFEICKHLILQLCIYPTIAGSGNNIPNDQTASIYSIHSRQDNSPGRKIRRLKDDRLTAFPELVYEFSEMGTPASDAIGFLVTEDASVPEGDTRRLRLERIRRLYKALQLDLIRIKQDVVAWDGSFVNEFYNNIDKLSKEVLLAFPNSKECIPWLRWCVVQSAFFQKYIHNRVFKSKNMDENYYHESDAARLMHEINLIDAENAKKK
jgi:hypothetical protein